jgi:hypothetical protein
MKFTVPYNTQKRKKGARGAHRRAMKCGGRRQGRQSEAAGWSCGPQLLGDVVEEGTDSSFELCREAPAKNTGSLRLRMSNHWWSQGAQHWPAKHTSRSGSEFQVHSQTNTIMAKGNAYCTRCCPKKKTLCNTDSQLHMYIHYKAE